LASGGLRAGFQGGFVGKRGLASRFSKLRFEMLLAGAAAPGERYFFCSEAKKVTKKSSPLKRRPSWPAKRGARGAHVLVRDVTSGGRFLLSIFLPMGWGECLGLLASGWLAALFQGAGASASGVLQAGGLRHFSKGRAGSPWNLPAGGGPPDPR